MHPAPTGQGKGASMQNLRSAFRNLARSPGFTTVAIITLALGIGLSASSFSIANAFLLRGVPYPESGELMRIFRTSRQSPRLGHSPGNLLDVRASVTSFSGFAIYNNDSFSLGEPDQPAEQVSGLCATSDFLDVLGVKPQLGRGFLPGEDAIDHDRVALLTYRAWSRRYANDPGVLGRDVRLNGRTFKIVGVLPPLFAAPLVWGPVDFVVPRTLNPEFATHRSNAWMHAVARLKPGVSLAIAQSELDTIAARLDRDFPKENGSDGLTAVSLHDSNMDNVSRSLLWMMTGISLTMLLIACANLASLQVARAFSRNREFAIRSALGGGRRQLMLPLLNESIVLSTAGGVAGIFVAWWSNSIIGGMLLIGGEPGFEIPIDGRVFAFAAFASVLSGIGFGVVPAWLSARAPAAEALKEGSLSSTASKGHQRLKRSLIVGELALALALVGIAAAFGVGARSFLDREAGWRMDGLYAGYFVLPYNVYPDDADVRKFHRALLDRLDVLPGVDDAVLATGLPVYSLGRLQRLVVEGQPEVEAGREPSAEVASVSPGYFSALRIPLVQGDLFPPGITENDPASIIVNEAFVRRFFPDEDPIGRRVRFAEGTDWMQVTGVVGDVKMTVRLDEPESRLHVFRPLAQAPGHYLAIVIRSQLPPETIDRSVRQAVAALDPDLPVARGGSLRADVDRNLANLDLVIFNLGLSAGMGLLIAAVGLFGVISQLTAQRTREIGVRIALGASGGDILRMILGEGGRMLVFGLIVGVPAYFGLSIFLRRAMPEMQLPGLWLLGATIAVLAATALFACWLPARNATRIDPIQALRSE